VDQARNPVAGFAANAIAAAWVPLIELDAKWYVKWLQPHTDKVITQLLHSWFVADSPVRIRSARWRLRGVRSTFPVDVIQMLGLPVIGFQIFIIDGPGRRHTPVVAQLAKIFFPQSKKGSAVELRISTNVVVRVRVKGLPGLVLPYFFRLVFPFDIDSPRIPVALLTRDVVASFQKQDSLARRSKGISERAPAGARADDDDVELILSEQVWLPA